jgi:opacity protein-like surface antigen
LRFGGGPPASFASISNTNSFGYTAGFGLEWAFWNNWSLCADYDYIGLPSQTFTVAPGPTTFGGDVITKRHDRKRLDGGGAPIFQPSRPELYARRP